MTKVKEFRQNTLAIKGALEQDSEELDSVQGKMEDNRQKAAKDVDQAVATVK